MSRFAPAPRIPRKASLVSVFTILMAVRMLSASSAIMAAIAGFWRLRASMSSFIRMRSTSSADSAANLTLASAWPGAIRAFDHCSVPAR
ncbi:hypothetical protein ES703_101146 [subsurface metagenome]